MKKILLVLGVVCFVLLPLAKGQRTTYVEGKSTPLPESKLFFPHNWMRGYTDFQVAPSHNEPDLGRCAYPPATGTNCTAYARDLFNGYIEFQPIGRTFVRRIFSYFEPKFSFGNNIPQLSYTSSMEPIAFERAIGVGFQLPHGLEIRATQHQVDYLGKYSNNLGPGDLHTNGPYGLYATVGVRWSFGGYSQAGNIN